MSFPIECSQCDSSFQVPDDLYQRRIAGKKVTIKCRHCGCPIRVDATRENQRPTFHSVPPTNGPTVLSSLGKSPSQAPSEAAARPGLPASNEPKRKPGLPASNEPKRKPGLPASSEPKRKPGLPAAPSRAAEAESSRQAAALDATEERVTSVPAHSPPRSNPHAVKSVPPEKAESVVITGRLTPTESNSRNAQTRVSKRPARRKRRRKASGYALALAAVATAAAASIVLYRDFGHQLTTSARGAEPGARREATNTNAGPREGTQRQAENQPAGSQPADEPATKATDEVATEAATDAAATEAVTDGVAAGEPATPQTNAPYDKQHLERTLSWATRQAEECHRGGRVSGTTNVRITFASTGRVQSAEIENPAIANAPVGKCVLAYMKAMVIPAYDGEPFDVAHSIRLD